MTDEFHGVTRDEYVTDRLLSEQDWADWRAARGWEAQHRPTHAEMVAHWAADRGEVERESLEGVAERAVIHDGWATGYPLNVQTVAARIPMSAQLAAELGLPWEPTPRTLTVHATLPLTGDGDPSVDDLRAQLAAIGFDTIDIEVA